VGYPAGKGLAEQIRALIGEHARAIWTVHRTDRVHPDFSRDPVLTPLDRHEAAFRLLRDLKQAFPLRNERDLARPVRPGRLLMQVGELLDGVPCLLLLAGRLPRMRERVMEAHDQGGNR
jgi:hypothetical protein